MSLYHGKKDRRYLIQKLPSFELLNILGIREGIEVYMETKQPLGGPVVIRVGNRSIAVAKTIAKQVQVEELEAREVVA